MSYWTTRTSGRARDFVVLKHALRNVNYQINGVTFRDGYGVVERNSKAHRMLKQIPYLRGAEELPLTVLRNLKFITRTSDVRNVFGSEIYAHFLKAEDEAAQAKLKAETEAKQAKEEAEQKAREEQVQKLEKTKQQLAEVQNIEEISEEFANTVEELIEEEQQLKKSITKCAFRTPKGDLCKHDACEESPSGYCRMHLLQDPLLPELGIEVPKDMDKKAKKKFRFELIKQLKRLKKQGVF